MIDALASLKRFPPGSKGVASLKLVCLVNRGGLIRSHVGKHQTRYENQVGVMANEKSDQLIVPMKRVMTVEERG